MLPAGPTKGFPARSSLSPGCSPTSITCARLGPSPNTVWVAFFQSGQARQSAASARKTVRLVLTVARRIIDGSDLVAASAIIARVAGPAVSIGGLTAEVSGRFLCFGFSTFSLAGLKMLAV